MNQEKIGKFIAQCRKEKNLTQVQLAEILKVTDRSVSKWENGKCMPDLSLFKPLCDTLGISINELLSGEKLNQEIYQEKLEENMVNTINYTNKTITKKNNLIAITLLIFGFITTLSAISIFPSDSSWSSIYSVIGVIISLIGFSKFTKKLDYIKRILLNLGFVLLSLILLFLLDFINVATNHQPPRFSYSKQTIDKMIIYKTPFYNVFRINTNTANEYYIIDTKKEYTQDTVPKTPFNRNKSSIENIIQYQNNYIGNNSNTSNLINHLPLSEYSYLMEIDSTNLGLIIDYHITDWYIEEDLYLQKSLLYNSISIFTLIDNVQYITYNFTGNSYTIKRETLENNYPNYSKIKINGKINTESFLEFIEQKLNDNKWVENIYNNLF